MTMNDIDHMNCQSDIEDLSECKDASHEDDWDDDFKKDLGLECESGSHTTSTPKPKSNLEEVIDLVIQDAIDYANSPEEKRILPLLTRKPNKGKNKLASTNNSISNHSFATTNISQHQVSSSNNSGMIMSANNNNQSSSFHPLMQQNLSHGMQHMLQLAATSKNGLQISGINTTSSNQHNSISQPQQQITNAMMGFSAAQIPNMIMPSYNAALSSNYSQQTQNSQYSLPVTLSQIQLAHQQQSQLILGNNQSSFTDISTTSNNQQQNHNFGAGSSNANPQHMQSSYVSFGSNSSIPVSPYQLPGMIQAYSSQSVSENSNNISQNDSQNSITNLSTNPSSGSCFISSKTNNTALTNNNPASSIQSNNNISSSAISASSLYQANAFDLQTQQLYAQQRLLQAQQQQQQLQHSNSTGLFPDYAAVMARYGAYQ